jgi:hypothetical protein
MSDAKSEAGPVEIWLTQNNMEINCMVVREDESTTSLQVESLSMRGAQREITGYLIDQGYTPAGRWEYPEDEESVRQFKAGPEAKRI